MHINQKILTEIKPVLQNKYHIYIDIHEWDVLIKPIVITSNEHVTREEFEERQKQALKLINMILMIHGKEQILCFLAELATIEPRIQELQPWVRDHVVHAVNTFILGVYILEKIKMPSFTGGRFDYPFMWKLCGPTHDLGYPIEIAHNISRPFYDKMNSILEDMNSPSPKVKQGIYLKGINKLCEGLDANEIIQNRLIEWGLGIDIKKYYKWLKRNNKTDHGVISALSQIKVIDALYHKANPLKKYDDIYLDGFNYNQENFDMDLVSASSALFVHNIGLEYHGFTNKISFTIAPLAFLLYLCDTLQEWDRYSENKPVFSGEEFELQIENNTISIKVPKVLEQKMYQALHQRLSGLSINVNEKIAVMSNSGVNVS